MPTNKVLLYVDDDLQELITDALVDEELPDWLLELLEQIDTWKEPV